MLVNNGDVFQSRGNPEVRRVPIGQIYIVKTLKTHVFQVKFHLRRYGRSSTMFRNEHNGPLCLHEHLKSYSHEQTQLAMIILSKHTQMRSNRIPESNATTNLPTRKATGPGTTPAAAAPNTTASVYCIHSIDCSFHP